MAQAKKIQQLDLKGEICPYPMMLTNKELDENSPGIEELEIITDHSPALSTIPPQALKRGYDCQIEEIKNGEWKIQLKKQLRDND
ncbi:MAG TPA: sulfurtransferase TusA family protein [Dehalococcoidia bacterium]|jgi:TusA-related sulfurtransferase|nr:sulfurtransferase TusA family protein [Dehalococcoidia bacterium]|tara:strand:+ start:91 stop:345 length:255 start_codon:yes stop_codon:yes gene_type:complete